MQQESSIKNLKVLPAPHIRSEVSLQKMMWMTVAALVFPCAGSVYFFGFKALKLILACAASAVFFEFLCLYLRRAKLSIIDGSAVVTGIILALVIPPSFPVWAAVLGVFFSICVVKHIFGGLGKNIFNPALMGRAFLTAAFPILITTYTTDYRTLPAKRKTHAITRAISSATPLSKIKFEQAKYRKGWAMPFFIGAKKGSTGETSGALILIGLIILLGSKAADWRLPLSYFGSVFIFSALLWLINPSEFINPFLAMLLGGVLLGGTFMVTDPVTTPVTFKGKWIFGIGAGILTVVIRNFSGYPEGVMFSILLMNSLTPLINRYTAPRIYGT
jgi:electron transport complex protein RnfD